MRMKRIKCKLTAINEQRLRTLFGRFGDNNLHILHGELTKAYVLRIAMLEALTANLDLSEKPDYTIETSLLVPEWLLYQIGEKGHPVRAEHCKQLSSTEMQSRLINAGLELLESRDESCQFFIQC
jgi:hypothetical protein